MVKFLNESPVVPQPLSKNPQPVSERKTSVVFYGDSPTCATGFGQVSRNILPGLYNTGKYDIKVCGINYWGDPHNYPFPIWPMAVNNDRDPYGRKRLHQHLMDPNLHYDVLFFLQDTFILDFLPQLITSLKGAGKRFKSIFYYPIDGKPKLSWVEAVNSVDLPITYTQFGKKQTLDLMPSLDSRLEVIPHGVNPEVFFPLPRDKVEHFRRQYFSGLADKFIITNVNRNQQRKDIPRTIQTFKEFRKHRPNSILYLHMAAVDQGWNLPEVIKSFGLDYTKDVILPQNFAPSTGFPLQDLNFIYNASDVIFSTTVGEGWGLSWSEAMACKVPVVFPDNTCLGEYITEDTGYLYKSGSNPSQFVVLPHDNEVVRPIADVEDAVQKLIQVYDNREEANRRTENAYNMVQSKLVWEKHIVPRWIELIDDLVSGTRVSTKVKPNFDLSRPVLKGELI